VYVTLTVVYPLRYAYHVTFIGSLRYWLLRLRCCLPLVCYVFCSLLLVVGCTVWLYVTLCYALPACCYRIRCSVGSFIALPSCSLIPVWLPPLQLLLLPVVVVPVAVVVSTLLLRLEFRLCCYVVPLFCTITVLFVLLRCRLHLLYLLLVLRCVDSFTLVCYTICWFCYRCCCVIVVVLCRWLLPLLLLFYVVVVDFPFVFGVLGYLVIYYCYVVVTFVTLRITLLLRCLVAFVYITFVTVLPLIVGCCVRIRGILLFSYVRYCHVTVLIGGYTVERAFTFYDTFVTRCLLRCC